MHTFANRITNKKQRGNCTCGNLPLSIRRDATSPGLIALRIESTVSRDSFSTFSPLISRRRSNRWRSLEMDGFQTQTTNWPWRAEKLWTVNPNPDGGLTKSTRIRRVIRLGGSIFSWVTWKSPCRLPIWKKIVCKREDRLFEPRAACFWTLKC